MISRIHTSVQKILHEEGGQINRHEPPKYDVALGALWAAVTGKLSVTGLHCMGGTVLLLTQVGNSHQETPLEKRGVVPFQAHSSPCLGGGGGAASRG